MTEIERLDKMDAKLDRLCVAVLGQNGDPEECLVVRLAWQEKVTKWIVKAMGFTAAAIVTAVIGFIIVRT